LHICFQWVELHGDTKSNFRSVSLIYGIGMDRDTWRRSETRATHTGNTWTRYLPKHKRGALTHHHPWSSTPAARCNRRRQRGGTSCSGVPARLGSDSVPERLGQEPPGGACYPLSRKKILVWK
jgi:hypothetical protein